MAQRIIILLLLVVVGLLAYGLVTSRQQTRLLEQLLSELNQSAPALPPESEPLVMVEEPAPPEPEVEPRVEEPQEEPEIVAEAPEPEVDPIEQLMPQPVVEVDEEPVVEPPAPPMVTPAPSPPAPADEWPRYSATVIQALRELLAGEYAAVTARFDTNLSMALPENRLAAVMEPLRRSNGGFVEIIDHAVPDVLLPRNLYAFRVTARTQRGEPLVFTITLNERQQIAGLYVR